MENKTCYVCNKGTLDPVQGRYALLVLLDKVRPLGVDANHFLPLRVEVCSNCGHVSHFYSSPDSK